MATVFVTWKRTRREYSSICAAFKALKIPRFLAHKTIRVMLRTNPRILYVCERKQWLIEAAPDLQDQPVVKYGQEYMPTKERDRALITALRGLHRVHPTLNRKQRAAVASGRVTLKAMLSAIAAQPVEPEKF